MSEQQPYILVVDDDPDILDGILMIHESQPYRLGFARDGKQCMESVAKEVPNLLILDLLMPRMDGWGVIREMRSDLTQYLTPLARRWSTWRVRLPALMTTSPLFMAARASADRIGSMSFIVFAPEKR